MHLQLYHDMKKLDFSIAEAAITLCHMTRESKERESVFDLKIDRMTSKYGERKHKETSALL